MIDRETRVLVKKEWQHLLSGKAALATGAILPIVMLGLVPWMLAVSVRADTSHGESRPLPEAMRVGVFAELGEDPHHFAGALLPMMVAIVGLSLPTMMASYLLISERERRTLELLVALPVRIEQVIVAKLVATLIASCAISVPLLVIDMIALPAMGAASFEQVVALPLMLLAALALSSSIALLMSLLAKDFRTANNVAGALLAPGIISTMVLGMLLPGGAFRPLAIAVAYALATALVTRNALRTVTFEKLLS